MLSSCPGFAEYLLECFEMISASSSSSMWQGHEITQALLFPCPVMWLSNTRVDCRLIHAIRVKPGHSIWLVSHMSKHSGHWNILWFNLSGYKHWEVQLSLVDSDRTFPYHWNKRGNPESEGPQEHIILTFSLKASALVTWSCVSSQILPKPLKFISLKHIIFSWQSVSTMKSTIVADISTFVAASSMVFVSWRVGLHWKKNDKL